MSANDECSPCLRRPVLALVSVSFCKSLDGFNPCLTTRRRLIDFVKSPNLFKISTSIVVNTGTLVTINPQLLVSLELVGVSGL